MCGRRLPRHLTSAPIKSRKVWRQPNVGKAILNRQKKVAELLADGRSQVAELVANAEKRASQIVEDAKSHAAVEAARITAQAKADVEQEVNRAREGLREQVAVLAVKGAEAILRSEVNAAKHADLLSNLKQEL